MEQDFSKRISIVIRGDLPLWQAMNVVAHIAAYIGNKMKEAFDTGEYFATSDGKLYPRNSQFPIIIFTANHSEIISLTGDVKNSGLLYLSFIREMIETTNDNKLQTILKNKKDEELEYLGVGFFGKNEEVKALTKRFSLWK